MFLPLFLLTLSAHADAPAVFAQDPICASKDFFQKDYDDASATHRKFPQLRAAYDMQNKWFKAVTGEMRATCDADKKFAAALLARQTPDLNGQCKPAEEAALKDQEVLEHSEKNLKTVQNALDDFMKKGRKGATDPLPNVALFDTKKVRDYAFTLQEVPFQALCEIKWLYPEAVWKTIADGIDGCPPLAAFDKPATEDKKFPALFSRLITRFNESVTYNTTRRNNAAATATASLARYQACVAQFPDVKVNPTLAKGTHGQGTAAPQGTNTNKGSDITGIEQDKKKQEQAAPAASP
jgi:hypothetical protein